jgi:hypothetical protein
MRAALAVERPRPCLTGAILVVSDVTAIAFAIAAAVLIRLALSGEYAPSLYWRLWPLLGLFAAAYGLFGLYPGVAMNPVMELRTTSYATTLVFLVLGALTFLLRNPNAYSRLAFFGAWLMALVAVPLARAMARTLAAEEPWWGYRTVILGGSGTGAAVLAKLVSQPEIGLRPVAIFDDDLARSKPRPDSPRNPALPAPWWPCPNLTPPGCWVYWTNTRTPFRASSWCRTSREFRASACRPAT